MRVNEIAIKTAKTGKVIVVVAVMSISSEKDESCQVLITEMKSLLAKRQKQPIFGGKFPRREKPFSKIEKRPDTKEISF
jgi:hypothetical protein